MKVLTKELGFIKVQSAFGGFVIYKPNIFLINKYDINNEVKIVSEHVNFHTNLASMKFYINPQLINNNLNIYNLNKLKINFISYSLNNWVKALKECKEFKQIHKN